MKNPQVEAVETWLKGAKEQRELTLRANGGSDLMQLLQPPGRSTTSLKLEVAKPDPGVRPARVRRPTMGREQKLLWCVRLREELVCCTAPVLTTLEASLDADRQIGLSAC